MPSVNVDLDFFDHRKVKRLVARLGPDADVLPIRLWCYCGKYHWETGELRGYSATEIEHLIGWKGEPGLCVKSMLDLFLHELPNGEGYAAHEWLFYQGHIAAFRAQSDRMRKAKLDKIAGKALPNVLPNALDKSLPKRTNAMQCNAMQGRPVIDAANLDIPIHSSEPTWLADEGKQSERSKLMSNFPAMFPADRSKFTSNLLDAVQDFIARAGGYEEAAAICRKAESDKHDGVCRGPVWGYAVGILNTQINDADVSRHRREINGPIQHREER